MYFLLFCENCDAFFGVDPPAEQLPTVVKCEDCGHLNNLFVCMNEGCDNLRPGDHAIMVRMGSIESDQQFHDMDFSGFDGPQYACSTKCLVEAMASSPYQFVPEADYRDENTHREWPPR